MTLIKILVELNAKKYAIYVEPNKNSLRNICLEISRQTKQLVSFELQLFEIFDKDFDEFVVISDADQPIEQLSKIRIKDKTDDTKVSSVGPKSVSDYNSVYDSMEIREDLNQCSGYSAEMTSSWVKSIVQIPDSIDNPMTQTFIKPFDTQSQRSFGRSSVKSFGLRSYTSEGVYSPTIETAKSKTKSTTGPPDSQRTTSSVKTIKDIDSFCDYLFDTNPSKSVINTPNKSLSSKRTVAPNRPSTLVSAPIRCQELEEIQFKEQSSVDPNKWFMNFSKEKNIERERVNTNQQFFRQTNDFELNSSNEDNTQQTPLFNNTSSENKLNNPSIGSINEWLFDSKEKQTQRINPNIEQISASSNHLNREHSLTLEVFRLPQNTKQLNHLEDFRTQVKQSMANNICGQQSDITPIIGDQCPESSEAVDDPVMDQSPADKLRKAMNSIKQNRLIENSSPKTNNSVPMTTITTKDLNSFNNYLFETDSDFLTKTVVKQNHFESDFFEQKTRSHSDISIDSNSCPINEMNIPSDSKSFELNNNKCDLNSNDIKDVNREIIPCYQSFIDVLKSPSSDQTLIDFSSEEEVTSIDEMIADSETNFNSYRKCDNNQSIWNIEAEQHLSDDSSEPTLISSPNESQTELNSELNITIQTPSEDSMIVSEQQKLPTNDSQTIELNVTNHSVEQKVINCCPEEHSIDNSVGTSCSDNSSEPIDWESDPDLKRIKINSFELFGESEPIKELLNLLDLNKTRFAKNPTTDSSDTSKWKIISEEMVKRGHKDWDFIRCKTIFRMSFRLYKESLLKCPDVKTALVVYPLFFVFHSVDLRFILTSEQFKQLEESKDIFNKKQISRERYPSVCSVGADLEDVDPIIDKIAIESTKLDKIRRMTEEKVNLFKIMVQFMDEITKDYGEVSKVKNFWELVTGLMKVNGFRIYDEKDFCQQFFRECVNDYYSMVLSNSPDMFTAQKVYRLFKFIHELNLKSYLTKNSFKKIKKLRKEFAERIVKTSSVETV